MNKKLRIILVLIIIATIALNVFGFISNNKLTDELEQINNDFIAVETVISVKTEEMTVLNSELETAQNEITAQTETINANRTILADYEVTILNLSDDIASKEIIVADKNSQIVENENQIVELEKRIAEPSRSTQTASTASNTNIRNNPVSNELEYLTDELRKEIYDTFYNAARKMNFWVWTDTLKMVSEKIGFWPGLAFQQEFSSISVAAQAAALKDVVIIESYTKSFSDGVTRTIGRTGIYDTDPNRAGAEFIFIDNDRSTIAWIYPNGTIQLATKLGQ